MLKFEIISFRIVESSETEKRYVAYMLQVRQDVTDIDANPVTVERRYTHFLDLYNGLRKDFPSAVVDLNFPKKAVMGNFDPELISARCTGFEALLELISNDSRLRQCPSTIAFMKDIEQNEAQRLMKQEDNELAFGLLETNFRLLNKVYTDRAREVLLALCRLVACSSCNSCIHKLAFSVERWATLALWRFNGVSDSELLQLYVPLLKCCIKIWNVLGKETMNLEKELTDLKKRGMKVDDAPQLLELIESIEQV